MNSFTSPEQNGTTTYYYKDSDQALANAVRKRLETIGTADKGVRKEEFYVIHHTTMPATLIETAFLSNLSDAALLRSRRIANAAQIGIDVRIARIQQFRALIIENREARLAEPTMALAIADGIGDYAANNPVNTTSGGS